MKISKLIETLQKCLEEYGDVEVVKYVYYYHKVQCVGLVEHSSERCRQVEIY